MSNKESVKVGVRIRPLNSREKNMNSEVVVSNEGNKLCIKDGDKSKQFIFDYVFGLDTQQKTIYENSVYSLVQNALQGYNGTIFAYGQTGAGKTFTMMGDYTNPQMKGIIPRTFDHVMVAIKTSEDKKFVLRTSFIEIYNEEILDLLEENKDKYKKNLRENPQVGVYIHQLKQVAVKSIAEMFQVLDLGNKHRTVGATLMNATSSRSHALFTIHIQSLEGEDRVKSSKVNLVDLAGSQRQSKTEATGERLKEGAKINLSLTALGNVINALVEGKKGGHIPYRDSKLTRLLQNSLGGNTKTLMIASVSPAAFNYDETISTLRYAARARNIKNTPKVNQDAKDTMIRQYYQQIQRLKKQLQLGGGCYIESKTGEESINISQMQQQVSEKDKKLSQKEQQLLETKKRLKQMEQLMLKKGDGNEKLVKQRMVKKKFIKKQQQLAKNNIKALEDQDQGLLLQNKQMSDTKIQEQLLHYKQLSKKLRKKLKSTINDKSDRQKQFQDQREDLNRTIRSLEQDLSFYRQISQKFLSLSDLTAIRDSSTLDIQKRQFTIRPFLLHDQKITLPKSLQQNEVDDLWKERRKGLKMEFMTSQKPPQSFIDKFSGQTNFSKTATEFMTNRGLIEKHKFDDPIYQEKQYGFEDAQRVIFRKANNIRIASRSRSRSTSKNKILQGMKKQQSLEKNSSITKVKLQPLKK